jgi:acetyl esterase
VPTRRSRPACGSGLRRLAVALTAALCALAMIGAGIMFSTTPQAEASAVTPHPIATHAAKGASRAVPIVPRVGIRTFVAPAGIRIASNLTYSSPSGADALKLDVCSPRAASASPQPAVLSIHGGSWTRGDKANSDWRAICQWLASEGFVTFSVDYRLVPAAHFPAPIDDVTRALAWMREPAHAARFNIDPRRIGVFGGSAGGSMAALLGMWGTGDTHTGTRVAAVAELSGPVDMTTAGQSLGTPSQRLKDIELAYLGCTEFSSCPAADEASAVSFVDSSDPPVFIGASAAEFIPVQQGQAFAAALEKAGVPHTLRVDPGHWHSIATLNVPMRSAVAAFLHRYLG